MEVAKKEIKDIYYLTPMQEGMLFHYVMDRKSRAYFEQSVLRIEGKIEKDLFIKSMDIVTARHDVLRTAILHEGIRRPLQAVFKERKAEVAFKDITAGDKEQKLKEIRAEDMERGFDLKKDSLMRVTLIKTAEEEYTILWSYHHIIMDGWCLGIIAKEVFELYARLKQGGGEAGLKAIEKALGEPYPYGSYIKWLERQDKEGSRQYWEKYLQGYGQQAVLLRAKAGDTRDGYLQGEYNLTLKEDITQRLKEIGQDSGVTMNTLFQAVWGILLQRYNHTEDVVYGAVVSGRPSEIEGIEKMVGLFINTVPVRVKSTRGQKFHELLKQIQEAALNGKNHEYLSLADIQSGTELKQGLIDHIMIYENYPVEKKITEEGHATGFTIKSFEVLEQTNYDFNIAVMPGDKVHIKLSYNRNAYDPEAIKRMAGHLRELIRSVAENPGIPVEAIEILTGEEKERLLYQFNDTAAEYRNVALHRLFEEQVERTPDNIALCFHEDISHLYKEMDNEKTDKGLLHQLLCIRFKQNAYVHQYEELLPIDFKEVFREYAKDEIRFLRTNSNNYVFVNEGVIALLKRFNGTNSLLEIYQAGCSEAPLLACLMDIQKGVAHLDKNVFQAGDFAAFIWFVKILYKAKLIEISGYDRTKSWNSSGQSSLEGLLKQGGFQGYEKTQTQLEIYQKEALPGLAAAGATGGNTVLLLGDTTGAATTGLLYIASYLRRHGIHAFCQWNDLNFDRHSLKKHTEELLEKVKPQIVGVSMKWFPHIARVLEICKTIKAYSPGIKVVVGGNTASYYREELSSCEDIDYIILGDGELPFLKICQNAADIPNCIYRDHGVLVKNEMTYVQDENNSSEIYFSDLEEIFASKADPYMAPYFYINTGKGCSMNCFYCAGCRETQKKVFNRPNAFIRGVDEVRKDILEVKKYTSTFMFDFDLPNYDFSDYYSKIWDGIPLKEHFGSMYFWKLPTPEFIQLTSKTFKYVYLNIDMCSLSERHRTRLSSLKLVKPQPTDHEILSFFEECSKYENIEVKINLIAGLPYFEKEDMASSEKMFSHLIHTYPFFKGLDWGRLHAQPGASLSENCEEHGMYTTAKSFEEFLQYSRLNLEQANYPGLEDIFYPFVYYQDEAYNSQITKHYLKINDMYRDHHRKRLTVKEELTYRELDTRANLLAGLLREQGVAPGSTVGILMERSTEMIVGILGILKAGGAYLPIDPGYPEERIRYMLEDSSTGLLITQRKLSGEFEYSGEKLYLEDCELYRGDSSNLPEVSADSLAYIIYTSGTTGRPKGVMVEHRQICQTLQWRKEEYQLDGGDHVLQLFSYAFDGFLTSFFTPVISGAKVVLLSDWESRNPAAIAESIREEAITHFICVPALYASILEQATPEALKSLRIVTLAGDKIAPGVLRESKEKCMHIELVNEYGPTEGAVAATIRRDLQEESCTVIGRPIANTKIYITNAYGGVQPIGIPGELCIAGGRLARGYLNQPGLTAEKFIPDPYDPGARMYRTGDLARWLPDGNIEFLGRIDDQVKIRGYRIELGEIEAQLLKIPAIKEAAVVAREDGNGNHHLCAYIVPQEEITASVIKEALSQELPGYMLPAYFIQLDQLPLTPNGKLDRRALPDSEDSIRTGAGYKAPENITEEKLVRIWQEVLGIGKIGTLDNFLDLGGHSLKATILVSRIHKEMGVEIPLRAVFNRPTVKSLASYIREQAGSIYASIEPVEKKETYPLSAAQKRLYILSQLEGAGISYNMTGTVMVEGEINKGRFEEVFKKLIERHETLRTSFEVLDGAPVQRIHEKVDFSIETLEAEEESITEKLKGQVRPFDLSKAPLLRVSLIKVGEDKHVLLYDMHHIISDGTTISIITKEFAELYKGKELPGLRLQYRDYTLWQNALIEKGAIKQQEEYWKEVFKEEIPVLSLPTDYTRPVVRSFEGETLGFETGKEIKQKLASLTRETGTTTYMVLLAAFNILLMKYTSQEDIVVGSPIAGRPHTDLEGMVGMFINTLAMRNQPRREKTFKEFLQEVKENALNAYENQDYQFEELVEKLEVRKDLSRNPLFDTMLVLQNIGDTNMELDGLILKPHEIDLKVSKFDLTLSAMEGKDNLHLSMEYCTRLFKKETMARMAGHYKKILGEILENPAVQLSDIEMLTEDEKCRILNEFNDTTAAYPGDKNICHLFEDQVVRTPDSIAVVFEDKLLTYRELNEKSNQLARLLREKGVKPDSLVGILAERSLEMAVGILGILKAGGAYLPIDPGYPADRIQYMLEDSGIKLLLTQDAISDTIAAGIEKIDLKDSEIYVREASNLDRIHKNEDLAYVIYTSGTTGKPKGVMIEHQSIYNTIQWRKDEYGLSGKHTSLQLFSYAFDGFVTSFFTPLVSGAKTVLVGEEDAKDPMKIKVCIAKHQVTHLLAVPAIFSAILESMTAEESSSLRVVTLAGDQLTPDILAASRKKNPSMEIVNEYGPTENSVATTISRNVGQAENITIGKPIANNRVYLMDGDKLQPVGVPGELCISGAGLARGYLNQPGLTAEKFVSNPLVPGTRMYRTGDLARWLPDGSIEFLGRMDAQVKVRGFRIELGEIEARLLSHPAVKAAVVTTREDNSGKKTLCAYVATQKEIPVSDIREHLSKTLPDYMLPSYIVQLEKLPLTQSGKVDRKALPQPEAGIDTGMGYQAPGDMMEEKLVQIWQEVLGIAKIGTKDNFFELGGHSLKATSLVSKIHKELGVEIPLKEIFLRPTVKSLAACVKEAAGSIYASIAPVEKQETYPLSAAQKRMYILNQMEGEGTAYNLPGAILLEGEIETGRFEEAFRKLIARHEILRTSFENIDGEPVQKVHERVEFKISILEQHGGEEQIKAFIKPFDLSKAPLIRAALINTGENRHVLLYDLHHIISDGMSMNIVTREFMEIYHGKELPELRLQYRDYTLWQNGLLEKGMIHPQEAYWKEVFKGEIPVLNLPTDYPRTAVQSFEGDRLGFEAGGELKQKLTRFMRETGTTAYMVLLAAYNTLLMKYTGQEDMIIGSPIAGRPHADLEGMIGMFVNTLAMRNYPCGKKTFREFLQEVKDNALRAYENQDYQFEALVEKLGIRRDMSRNPLFDVMFTVQNAENTEMGLGGLKMKPWELENRISKFDLTFSALEGKDTLYFNMEYCTRLFKKETIQRMGVHYIKVLEEVIKNPDLRLSEVEILSPEEKHRILYEFSGTTAAYPREKTIPQLFEEQVERTPDHIAVVYGDQQLTYRELNEQSNRLAGLLREKGVKADSIVGILAERSLEMIIGIFGIMKAGGAYLPLDPGYPEDRIHYMLEDSGAALLLTHAQVHKKVEFKGEILQIEDSGRYAGNSGNLVSINKPEDLVYVMYTSGTTGKPKGNLTTHRNVINVVKDPNYIRIDPSDRLLQLSNYAFDGSTFDIFAALLNGAKLVLISQYTALDMQQLSNFIKKEKITVFFVTTALFNAIMDLNIASVEGIRKILFGGENVSVRHVKKFFEKYGKDKLIHMYGPTESTVFATFYEINSIHEESTTIPIGKPVANDKIFILDKDHRPQPIGVVGELCISGDGLARGYLNQPGLTEEKFVPNPYLPGERMYRTGDLARWLPDGNIEFIGRIDHQVKMRGFRIELAEIEAQLLEHPAVKEAVVLAREDESGSKYLCAYMTAEEVMQVSALREHLSKSLPDYMVPSYFVQMEKLPLNPNGKVDRKALPEPDVSSSAQAYEAPANETEEKLAAIWQEVLGIERIGTNDNFFDLGGHSLKATMLVAKIHKEMNVEIPLREVFSRATVKGLAAYMEEASGSIYTAIKPVEKRETYPLSAAQKRLYIVSRLEGGGTAYNIPGTVILEGELDKERLEEAFRKLVERHETLRTSFEMIGGEPVQRVHEKVEFHIDYIEEKEEKALERINEFIQPFDLSKAPLLKVSLIKVGENRHILLYDLHHIISDGTTMSIIINEFAALYEGQELPPLRLQYRDYTLWQNGLAENGILAKQEAYWKELFKGEIPVLNLPEDYPRPAVQSFEGDGLSFEADERVKQKITLLARETGTTVYMVLLAAFNTLLMKYTGREDVIVGSPIAGRPHADLEGIVGMFVNILAMRNYPGGEKTFGDFLAEVKENALRAFENQDCQFEELVEKLDIRRDMSRNPLFDVVFTVQNVDNGDIELEGLKLKSYEMENKISKFDLALIAVEGKDKIHFGLEYCTRLFKKETIERMAAHYKRILEQVLENPGIKLSEVEILTEEEKHRILYGFNHTRTQYPRDRAIQQLFEQQVEKTPDNLALVFGDKKLTYRELNIKANRLARALRRKGVSSDQLVGIMTEHPMEAIIGILGILKAGGAYLPIDAGYPQERIMGILEDSKASLLLTESTLASKVPFTMLQGLDAEDIGITLTSARPQIKDLDRMPYPDRTLVDYSKYRNYIGLGCFQDTIAIQTTRGCPYNCFYCHKIWPKSHVVRSAENIFREVLHHYGLGKRNFVIIDDIFNLDIKNSSRFFELIIENNLKLRLSFPNGIRGDILTKEYIDLMVRAGTVQVALALETASPRLQKLIGKNLNIEKLRQSLEYFAQEYPNVILDLFFMVGFPTETEEEAQMTLDFVKSIHWLHFPVYSVLKIYPNTDMEKLALQSGVSKEAIHKSTSLAYHELPDTLPFSKSFVKKLQASYMNDYFLNKERLGKLIEIQRSVMTEDEIIQKYNSYLPSKVETVADIMKLAGVPDYKPAEVYSGETGEIQPANTSVRTVVQKAQETGEAPLRLLLLDLSQYFSGDDNMLYNVAEPPLGLMYILTYLNEQLGSQIEGRIMKSRFDFDSFEELKQAIMEFKPDVIGVRSLTFYKDFYHQAITLIRQWGIDVPIIAGGPYATSDYRSILRDSHIDIVSMGEGELTMLELMQEFIKNNKKLPSYEVLRNISGIAFVEGQEEKAPNYCRQVVLLDEMEESLLGENGDNLQCRNTSRDLAYVIYTSGSTGKPKGSMIEHRSVIRLVKDTNYICFEEGDRILKTGAMVFDASTFEIWGALLNGLRLYLADEHTILDAKRLDEVLKQHEISTMWLTSPLFNQLFQQNADMFSGLKNLLVGGDVLSPKHINGVRSRNRGLKVINGYGPTENTTFSTCFLVDKDYEESIPIGKPISNSTAYIVDPSGRLQPIGIWGELWVGGDGVARGYVNQPGFTEEKFIPDPFNPGERLYKTGDIARWLPDGNIEFLGRMDSQVKIRGFRIELGEIEAQLLSHPDIKEAFILAREDGKGDKYLCAYIVAEGEVTISGLKTHLSQVLPDYMLPSYFVQLEKLPLTMNGKVDRKALPEPDGSISTGIEYEAPNGEIEENIAKILKGVLNLEKTGVNDNFFDLGGDSMSLIQMHSQVDKLYPGIVKVTDLFANPTIRKLGEFIGKNENALDSKRIAVLPFPEEYFTEATHNFNSAVYGFSITGDFLENIRRVSESEKVKVEDVLLTIYVYLLADIAEQEALSVQTALNPGGLMTTLQVALDEIESLNELISMVSRMNAAFDEKNAYALESIKNSQPEDFRLSVVPAFLKGALANERTDLADYFDIIFKLDEKSDRLDFNCEFSSRIIPEKGNELVNRYVAFIETLVNSYAQEE